MWRDMRRDMRRDMWPCDHAVEPIRHALAIQFAGPAPSSALPASRRVAERDHEVGRVERLAPEVRRVERGSPHRLIDVAQIGEGEGFLDEREGHGRVLQLNPRSLHAVMHDRGVVEGERRRVVPRQVGYGPEARAATVRGGSGQRDVGRER